MFQSRMNLDELGKFRSGFSRLRRVTILSQGTSQIMILESTATTSCFLHSCVLICTRVVFLKAELDIFAEHVFRRKCGTITNNILNTLYKWLE